MSDVCVRYSAGDFNRALADVRAAAEEWESWGEILTYAGFDPLAAAAAADGFCEAEEDVARETYLVDEDEDAADAWRCAYRTAFWHGLRIGEALARTTPDRSIAKDH